MMFHLARREPEPPALEPPDSGLAHATPASLGVGLDERRVERRDATWTNGDRSG
jgi:hypothetical protein